MIARRLAIPNHESQEYCQQQRLPPKDSLERLLHVFIVENTITLNRVTNPNERKEVLKRDRRCFDCTIAVPSATRNINFFPKICSPLSTTLDLSRYPHLHGLQFSDLNLLKGQPVDSNIDVLLGADYYFEILTGDIVRGGIANSDGWSVDRRVSQWRQRRFTSEFVDRNPSFVGGSWFSHSQK